MNIEDRGALVTGGAVRIGRAIVRELAAQGASVFIHYHQSQDAAARLRDEIRAAGGTAEIGSSDLSDRGQAADLLRGATDAVGPVSILVNSASGFPRDSFEDVTPSGWAEVQNLTLGSTLSLTQSMSEALPEGSEGAVVNLTDIKTARPDAEHFSYVMAKGGVDTLTRASALALAPAIRVNAVALGNILPPAGESDEETKTLALDTVLRRIGGAGVVAEAVLFLIKNDFITGEIIRLDGGAHLL